jgi:hypothetical protein
MKEEVSICAWMDCEREFKPRHGGHKFCCRECREAFTLWNAREQRRRKTVDTTARLRPVFAFIKQHQEETGELLSYGKAVLLMELKKGRSKR